MPLYQNLITFYFLLVIHIVKNMLERLSTSALATPSTKFITMFNQAEKLVSNMLKSLSFIYETCKIDFEVQQQLQVILRIVVPI